jgi:nucleoside-diphosphate-sugar epimerase
MKILVTGNLGYVGPPVIQQLRLTYPDAELIGMDLGVFAHCLTGAEVLPERIINTQLFKDVRNVTKSDFKEVSAVVHLAAISNDPMGNSFEKITDEINRKSSLKIAELAKDAGVRNYVFASSCSVYGAALGRAKREDDELNPLTAYAKSKIDTELGLAKLASEEFVVTCLRFATACGFSARTRLDLVVNDFVAGALANGVIKILSDGSPWRPLIHVSDMARAIDWAVDRKFDNGGAMLVLNTGSDEWNYQVKDLANAVAAEIPGTKIEINENAEPDNRSYKVDFSKFREFAPKHQPQVSLSETVQGLRDGLVSMAFADADFHNSDFMRLNALRNHMNSNRLTQDLTWIAN